MALTLITTHLVNEMNQVTLDQYTDSVENIDAKAWIAYQRRNTDTLFQVNTLSDLSHRQTLALVALVIEAAENYGSKIDVRVTVD